MDDFDDLRDDDFGFDNDFSSAPDAAESSDEFDQLRRSSARSETMFNDLNDENRPSASSSSGFSMSNFTAGQRLVLALLVVLNIIVIGIFLVVLWGIISN